MNREARATLIAGGLVCAFWWIAGFGVARAAPDLRIFRLPGWFVLGSVGSWVLAVGLTVFLALRVFKNFSLEDDDGNREVGHA
jgi:uncharacterized membrane protein YhdT